MFLPHSVFIISVKADTTISGSSTLISKNKQYCALIDNELNKNNDNNNFFILI